MGTGAIEQGNGGSGYVLCQLRGALYRGFEDTAERKHLEYQAIYELLEGKLPTLKELTAEYAALKGQLDAYKPDLAELKSKLTDLKHIRYNYKILARDIPQTDQYHRKGERIEL